MQSIDYDSSKRDLGETIGVMMYMTFVSALLACRSPTASDPTDPGMPHFFYRIA